jgi:hypothetical protein
VVTTSIHSAIPTNFIAVPLVASRATPNTLTMTEIIYGKRVILRPATPMDRKPIFDWLTNSDLTNQMMGPPTYPDSKIPTWDEFIEDYKEYFFDSSKPLLQTLKHVMQ